MPQSAGIPPGISEDLNTILAPWLYGSMVSSLLLGVLIVQVWLYFLRYKSDRWLYKVVVILLLISSLAVWGSCMFILDHVFIQNYGDMLQIHAWPLAVFVPLAAPAISAMTSQALFGYRLWTLSGRRVPIAVAILLIMAINLASGLAAIIIEGDDVNGIPLNGNDLLLFVARIGEHARHGFWRIIIWNEAFLWISACTDVVLTGSLAYFLLTRRRRTERVSRDTNAVVTRVLVLSFTTGGITSLFSVATAVLVIATINSNNVAQGLILQLAHVYSIVCLSSLLLRQSLAPANKSSASSRTNYSARGHQGANGQGSLSLVKSRSHGGADFDMERGSTEALSPISAARSPLSETRSPIVPPPDMLQALLRSNEHGVATERPMAEKDPLQMSAAAYFVPRPPRPGTPTRSGSGGPTRSASNGSLRAVAAANSAAAHGASAPVRGLYPLVTDLRTIPNGQGQSPMTKSHGHTQLPSASYASPIATRSHTRDVFRG